MMTIKFDSLKELKQDYYKVLITLLNNEEVQYIGADEPIIDEYHSIKCDRFKVSFKNNNDIIDVEYSVIATLILGNVHSYSLNITGYKNGKFYDILDAEIEHVLNRQ